MTAGVNPLQTLDQPDGERWHNREPINVPPEWVVQAIARAIDRHYRQAAERPVGSAAPDGQEKSSRTDTLMGLGDGIE